MKAYRIRGRFRMGRGWQIFAKEIAAEDEPSARERLLSVLGSQHRVARKYVQIAEVTETAPSEVQDPAVRYAVEGSR